MFHPSLLLIGFIALMTLSCTSTDSIKELHLSTALGKYTATARRDTSKFVRIPLCKLVNEKIGISLRFCDHMRPIARLTV